MKKKLFRIPASKTWQAELEQKVRVSLRHQKKHCQDYAHLWETKLETTATQFPILKRTEFLLLKKQFEHGRSILLPVAVKAARRVITLRQQWLRKLRMVR